MRTFLRTPVVTYSKISMIGQCIWNCGGFLAPGSWSLSPSFSLYYICRLKHHLKALDLGIILHGQTSLQHFSHLSYHQKCVFWLFGPSGLSYWAILDFSMRLDSSTPWLSDVWYHPVPLTKNGVMRSKTKIVRKKTENRQLSNWAALSSGTHTKVIPIHGRYDHGIWFWSTPFEGWPHGPTLSKIFC